MKHIFVIFAALVFVTVANGRTISADVVVVNANIHTMNAQMPTARSMAY